MIVRGPPCRSGGEQQEATIPTRIPITNTLSLSEDEIEISFIRSSGPGGQNVNKVSTAVQLRFDLRHSPSLSEALKARAAVAAGSRLTLGGEIVLTADRFRTQALNRSDAVARLLELLRTAATPPKPRRATRPTLGSKVRRLDAKTQRGGIKRLRRPPEVRRQAQGARDVLLAWPEATSASSAGQPPPARHWKNRCPQAKHSRRGVSANTGTAAQITLPSRPLPIAVHILELELGHSDAGAMEQLLRHGGRRRCGAGRADLCRHVDQPRNHHPQRHAQEPGHQYAVGVQRDFFMASGFALLGDRDLLALGLG